MHLNLHTTINTTEKIDPKLPASKFISDKLEVFYFCFAFSRKSRPFIAMIIWEISGFGNLSVEDRTLKIFVEACSLLLL